MKKIRLTEAQETLMRYVRQVDIPGTHENKNGYFYTECNAMGFKPFNARTVFSLIEKGLIEHADEPSFSKDYNSDGVYALRPKRKNK